MISRKYLKWIIYPIVVIIAAIILTLIDSYILVDVVVGGLIAWFLDDMVDLSEKLISKISARFAKK